MKTKANETRFYKHIDNFLVIPADVKNRVEMIKEINEVEVEITFDPPYSQDLMSEEAKLELGFM